MKNPTFVTAAAILSFVAFGSPAFAASEAECTQMFAAADTNNDGSLSQDEGRQYFAALRSTNRMVPTGPLDKAAFMGHCKEDAFAIAKVDPGAPLEGANSFTEAQAKDRIEAVGYSDVSGLSQDTKGVWRGTAKKGATLIKIAVDYKGNVVAQ